MTEMEIAPWLDAERVDVSAEAAISAAERTAAPRCCVCGRLLGSGSPRRLTCGPTCKLRRDNVLKRVERRRGWILYWDALRGRSTYSAEAIAREVEQLEADIRELLLNEGML